jgi:hypothetical protein
VPAIETTSRPVDVEDGESASRKNHVKSQSPSSSTSDSDSQYQSPCSSSECPQTESSPSPLEEAQLVVEKTISRLHRLSTAIRRAGVHYRDLRADQFIDTDENGKDLTAEYAQYAAWIVGLRIPEAAPASEALRNRVAESIAKRHNQFSYRRNHQRKLSRRLPEVPLPPNPSPQEYTAPKEQSQSVELPVRSTPSTRGLVLKQETVPSHTSASRIDTEDRPKLTRSSKGSTVASRSFVLTGKLDFPRPPKVDPRSDMFECPYCCILCPIEQARGKRWRFVKLNTYNVCYPH